ncbi:hypothetical protein TRIP_C21171 [Candidatus Zixiibacteriota bacterium]|nr:hypothetical protein TRIP_C21171 [candidate division Zixibacteria bacterium]
MGFSEEIFSLKNNKGEMMYGVVHHPARPNGALVMMFNIGLHYRVCHSRLFVRQARDLQNRGFLVVRMDTSKVGYSHGEIPVGRAIDSYDAVQTGLFKDDALIFLTYLRDRFRPKKIFFTGLCGGALTAIIAGAAAGEVDGVVFIAGPVTVTSPEYELSTMHPFQADILVAGYLKRLMSPSAWARFFSGRTSYRSLFTSLKVKLATKFKRDNAGIGEATNMGGDEEENKGDLFNRVFYESFEALMRTERKILFLMPELDRATYDFDSIFARQVLGHFAQSSHLFKVARIPKANHTFSTPESTRCLFEETANWLNSNLS